MTDRPRFYAPLPNEVQDGITTWPSDTMTRPVGDAYDPGPTPTVSGFFRGGSNIPEVCDLAVAEYRRREGAEHPFTAVSVGCSFGPEVDSVLAHITRTAPGIGRITMLGLDVHPPVLEAAASGRYHVYVIVEKPERMRTLLDPFDVEGIEDISDIASLAPYRTRYRVNTTGLRELHNVSFERADLSDPKTTLDVVADLVLCNNLIEHLPEHRGSALLAGMYRQLRPGGVLSIGALQRSIERGDNAVGKAEELGLEPMLYSKWLLGGFPFVFRKPLEP